MARGFSNDKRPKKRATTLTGRQEMKQIKIVECANCGNKIAAHLTANNPKALPGYYGKCRAGFCKYSYFESILMHEKGDK